jgi:hypothetical protein
LAASLAAEVGADVAAAAGVKRESWRAALGGVVAVAPFHQHDQGGREHTVLDPAATVKAVLPAGRSG